VKDEDEDEDDDDDDDAMGARERKMSEGVRMRVLVHKASKATVKEEAKPDGGAAGKGADVQQPKQEPDEEDEEEEEEEEDIEDDDEEEEEDGGSLFTGRASRRKADQIAFDDSEDAPPPRKRRARGAPSTARIHRVQWSMEEKDMLREGVSAYGLGKWAEILKAYDFHKHRTNVDLKDKWRNMVKHGEA